MIINRICNERNFYSMQTKRVELKCLKPVVGVYNKLMGGVNLADMLSELYMVYVHCVLVLNICGRE